MGVLSGYLFRNRNTVVIICGLSIECESSHQLVWKHFKEVIQYNMNKDTIYSRDYPQYIIIDIISILFEFERLSH